jgi:mitochondrial fission protein ELM1
MNARLASDAGLQRDRRSGDGDRAECAATAPAAWVLAEDKAGMLSQAIGLAEAVGLCPDIRLLRPLGLRSFLTPALWWSPLSAIDPAALAPPITRIAIGCGGMAGAVLSALRSRTRTVIVQHPRRDIRDFDLVLAAVHDEVTGPNVLVTRTALHRVTPARLAAAARDWAPRLAHLPRPLVAVLIGGSNGRYRLDRAVAEQLAGQLAEMLRRDHVGMIVTPSRRTDPTVRQTLERTLCLLGAEVWDGTGDNPYFGMLALADAVVVTCDSVSMVSEAVATRAPVLLAPLPGRSRRNRLFLRPLLDAHRIRPFAGRLELWPVEPIDDTPEAAAEMCRRLDLEAPRCCAYEPSTHSAAAT